jgi:hypothetical protein
MIDFILWLFSLRERTPLPTEENCGVGPRDGLDIFENIKIPCSCWDSNPDTPSLYHSYDTKYAVLSSPGAHECID